MRLLRSLKSPSPVLLGIFHYVFATFVFSTLNCLVKILSRTYPIHEILLFRSGVPIVILLSILTYRNQWSLLRTGNKGKIIGRGFLSVAGLGLMFYAFKMLPLSEVTLYLFTAPLFTLILAHFFLKEKVTFFQIMVVLLGFLGILIASQTQGHFKSGVWIALASAFLMALSNILIRDLSRTESHEALMFWVCVMFVLAVLGPCFYHFVKIRLDDLPLLLCIGVLGYLGQNSLILSVTYAPVSIVAPFSYTGFLWAVIYGTCFFGETLTLPIVCGAFLIMLSGYLNQRIARRQK